MQRFPWAWDCHSLVHSRFPRGVRIHAVDLLLTRFPSLATLRKSMENAQEVLMQCKHVHRDEAGKAFRPLSSIETYHSWHSLIPGVVRYVLLTLPNVQINKSCSTNRAAAKASSVVAESFRYEHPINMALYVTVGMQVALEKSQLADYYRGLNPMTPLLDIRRPGRWQCSNAV